MHLFRILAVCIFITSCGGGGGGGSPAVPFALTLASNSFSTDEDTSYSGSFAASANETVTLEYLLTETTSNGSLSFSNTANIVYNPKDSASYLYLAKIFKIEEDKRQEEKNIKTTLLLDPKNEEAMFLLIDMELERSNFSKADELSKDFKKICVDMCEKIASIESRLKDFERKDAS